MNSAWKPSPYPTPLHFCEEPRQARYSALYEVRVRTVGKESVETFTFPSYELAKKFVDYHKARTQ